MGDDIQPQQDAEQFKVEDMDQEALVPQQVTDVNQPTQQERDEHKKRILSLGVGVRTV